MKEIAIAIRNFLRARFNLNEDKADEDLIVDSINRNVHFTGTNLWTLIFAILIASIGLNVNSTAVVIGAMLISPLMGPIMGIGLGIGILDFNLVKKGINNLFIAAAFAILTSSLYFFLTPLHEAQSEILARTTPSLWDVLIAFCGGMAGIIAGTRKEKSNVLPGVAIATALMPPLCTAGYGLATGQWRYFGGAIYLFFINSVFICLSTYIVVRMLKFKKVRFATEEQHRTIMRYTTVVALATLIPSVYLAVRIVQKAIFEQNAKNFVQSEFRFAQTQVINRVYTYDRKRPVIELFLIGQELTPQAIDSLKKKMHLYGLDSNSLIVKQGMLARRNVDVAQIKAGILEEVLAASYDTEQIPNKLDLPLPELATELHILQPDLLEYSFDQAVVVRLDSLTRDTIPIFIGVFRRYLSTTEKEKLDGWLRQRAGFDTVKLVIQTRVR